MRKIIEYNSNVIASESSSEAISKFHKIICCEIASPTKVGFAMTILWRRKEGNKNES